MAGLLQDTRIVYIGCGHMGSALVRASIASGAVEPAQHILVDHHPERLLDLMQAGAVVLSSTSDIAPLLSSLGPAAQTLVVLGVKPQALSQLLPTLPAQLIQGSLVLSLAVGVRLDALAQLLAHDTLLARLMPNLGAQVGRSASTLCMAPQLSLKDQDVLKEYVSSFGSCCCVSEDEMDVAGVIAGSSPALYARVIDLLATQAKEHGFDYQTAVYLAAQTMEATAQIMSQGKDPQTFVSQVCSPQGTTEAGLAGGQEPLKAGVQGFVAGALRRTQELRNGA